MALARAILKDAPIVVLDEASSFADPENEAKIQKAFEALMKGKTVLMIAHRLSTVRNMRSHPRRPGRRDRRGRKDDELLRKGRRIRRYVGEIPKGCAVEGGRCRMIERIRKKYAMTEKGAKDYVAAVFWSVLVNIRKILPVGVLATALSGIVEALTNGTDPRAGLTRFLVAGVLALAALFVTFLIQYKALYEATYRESANRRIRLAEVLRQLPLSFFGNRDLTDLTTTIMGDTETLEKAFSHFYPAMHGALISTALISAGMLLYDWRMALALCGWCLRRC